MIFRTLMMIALFLLISMCLMHNPANADYDVFAYPPVRTVPLDDPTVGPVNNNTTALPFENSPQDMFETCASVPEGENWVHMEMDGNKGDFYINQKTGYMCVVK